MYSEADRHALHVEMADEAMFIGDSPPRDSYLRGDAVLAAALKSGADAIHPGYGFLSENAGFCRQCAEHNSFLSAPRSAPSRPMGSKSAAKRIMERAAVPLVPGYHGDDQDPAVLLRATNAMGYPVLLKAVAGGGGKGMRIVENEQQFDAALASAQREAAKILRRRRHAGREIPAPASPC